MGVKSGQAHLRGVLVRSILLQQPSTEQFPEKYRNLVSGEPVVHEALGHVGDGRIGGGRALRVNDVAAAELERHRVQVVRQNDDRRNAPEGKNHVLYQFLLIRR